MAKVDKISCDWDNCRESIETVPGQPFTDTWLTMEITNNVTGQTTVFHLDPIHARLWRDTGGMKILESLIPTR